MEESMEGIEDRKGREMDRRRAKKGRVEMEET